MSDQVLCSSSVALRLLFDLLTVGEASALHAHISLPVGFFIVFFAFLAFLIENVRLQARLLTIFLHWSSCPSSSDVSLPRHSVVSGWLSQERRSHSQAFGSEKAFSWLYTEIVIKMGRSLLALQGFDQIAKKISKSSGNLYHSFVL